MEYTGVIVYKWYAQSLCIFLKYTTCILYFQSYNHHVLYTYRQNILSFCVRHDSASSNHSKPFIWSRSHLFIKPLMNVASRLSRKYIIGTTDRYGFSGVSKLIYEMYRKNSFITAIIHIDTDKWKSNASRKPETMEHNIQAHTEQIRIEPSHRTCLGFIINSGIQWRILSDYTPGAPFTNKVKLQS